MDRYSILWLWLMGLVGVLIVAGLAMLGVNLASSARTGPRWKRKLVAAGLILLGIGVGGDARGDRNGLQKTCYQQMAIPEPARQTTLSPSATAEQNVMWKQVVTAWHEGQEIAGRTRRTYPQTKAEKDALLAALASARKNVQTLAVQKMLSESGAKLLTDELNGLTQSVASYRPEAKVRATCYRGMALQSPQTVSLMRLAGRMATLEKLIVSGTLKPGPSAQVAAMIRRDAAVLREPIYQARMKDSERTQAKALVTRADALLAKLPAPPKATPSTLERSAQWKQIQAVKTLAQRYAKNGSTQAQRTAFDKQLAQANAATKVLSRKGMMSWAAAELLRDELTQGKKGVYAGPPKDSKVLCYDMMLLHPAAESMKRLTRRMDLLDLMLRRSRLRPETIRALLPSFERDLAVLSDPKQIATLPEYKRAAATAMKSRAEKTIAALQAYVKRNTP